MQADPSSMRAGAFKAPNATGFHTVCYVEHGAPDSARTIVCVHGLTRNGRDFDPLADALAAAGFRVVCPDIVGRGRSDRLADPAGYNYSQYQQDMTALIAHLGVETVDWVGTSMGGLIGMLLAARPGTPIARLVVNDIGPFLPKAALVRLAQYVGLDPAFPDRTAGEAYLRQVFAPFGRLSDADWRALADHSLVAGEGGFFRLAYDPAIRQGLLAAQEKDVDLWPIWDAIRVPTLLLWGQQSDLLTGDLVETMLKRGPKPTLVSFDDVGHAPPLRSADQIRPVVEWLSARA
jgi:pimeloyl-ACP methyl ester carboxylesterase